LGEGGLQRPPKSETSYWEEELGLAVARIQAKGEENFGFIVFIRARGKNIR